MSSDSIDPDGFVAARVHEPWHEFSTWSSWTEAVEWALQGIVKTAIVIRRDDVGDGAVGWTEFEEQLAPAAFEGLETWREHPIVQRVLKAARQRVPHGPLGLSTEAWLEIGVETESYINTWHTDPSDLMLLASELGYEPTVWLSQPTETVAEGTYDLQRDFVTLMQWYVGQYGTLPDRTTIDSWFGKKIRPEAIVSRCTSSFPQGLASFTPDQIGAFYLGRDTWARTSSWYGAEEAQPKQSRRPLLQLDKDFARFVKRHLTSKDGLPSMADIHSRFGQDVWPEAVVARFRTDFPQGVTARSGHYSQRQIEQFYLTDETRAVMAAVDVLMRSNDAEQEKRVDLMIRSIGKEIELTEAQLVEVTAAMQIGLLTVYDDE